MDLNFFIYKNPPKCHDYFSADGRRLWESGAGYSLRALNVVFFGVRWIGRRCWRKTEGVGVQVDPAFKYTSRKLVVFMRGSTMSLWKRNIGAERGGPHELPTMVVFGLWVGAKKNKLLRPRHESFLRR